MTKKKVSKYTSVASEYLAVQDDLARAVLDNEKTKIRKLAKRVKKIKDALEFASSL